MAIYVAAMGVVHLWLFVIEGNSRSEFMPSLLLSGWFLGL